MAERGGMMALIHDSTAKDLIKASPLAWLRFPCPNLPENCSFQIEDGDLSHVSAAADAVIQVFDPTPWIAHFEFYSRSEPELERKLVGYHGSLFRRWDYWIECTVFLLRSEANVPNLKGTVQRTHPLDPSRKFFVPYRLIRLWTRDADEFLEGGLGMLPLAVLAKGSNRRTAASVWEKVQRRVEEESATEGQVRKLLEATKTMLGLKFGSDFVERTAAKMIHLEDSSVVQAIIERHRTQARNEGRVEERIETQQKILLKQGRRRFGEPSASELAKLNAIKDGDRLERLAEQILDAANWKDLLKTR